MRNLKRALSLALAAMMLIGMMVVSAGAVEAKDFTDRDEIQNIEAVNTLVALNVISGKEDGSYFDPTGIVTRAEMAKMITIVLNGGREPNLGNKVTPSYTDIKGHWAEAYIEYCTSLGILSGRGNGKFDPNATITGSEAAKVVLIAMGYSAENSKFVGNSWEINVNAAASSKGLYDGMSVVASAPLNRDNAALMVFNGLNATMVEYDYKLNTVDGNLVTVAIVKDRTGTPTPTLLTEKFGMQEFEGSLTNATYNTTTKKYTYTVDKDGIAADSNTTNEVTVVSTTDFSALVGQKVKALYKVETDGTQTAYGLFSTAATVSATVGELDLTPSATDKVKLAGTEYTLNSAKSSVDVYYFNAGAVTDTGYNLNAITADKASGLTLVDTDKDGKYNYAVVSPVTVAKVTYVGTNGITAGGAYTFEDDKIEEGLVKGDFVTVVASANTVYPGAVISKVETVTATVDGIKNSTDVLVGGTWYKRAMNAGDAVALNKTFTFAVIGGYYYNAEAQDTTATMDTLLLATDKGSVNLGVQQAKFLNNAGETVIYNVSKIGGNDVASSSNEVAPGTLYTYKVKDGNYELTAVSASNNLGYTFVADDGAIVAKTTTTAAHTITSSIYFDKDAVVFIKNTDPASKVTWKVVNGASVNDWASNYGDSSQVLYKTINGVKYAVAAYIVEGSGNVPSASGEVGNYGYVVSAPYRMEENDTAYDTYEIWNGSEVITVKDEDADLAIAKGDIISYTGLGNGVIKTSTKVAGGATAAVAVTGYTDTLFQAVKYDGAAITDTAITKDTVIMYVDSKAGKGVAGGSIELAAVQADGSRIMNAWTVGDSAGKVKLIVVDVNNDIEDLANNSVSSTGGAAGYTVASINGTAATGSASNTTMTIGSIQVTKDLTYALDGDKVVLTVKCGEDNKAITGAGITLTCDGVTVTVGANADIDSGVTIATLTVPAKSASNYQITVANAT